MRYNHWLDGAIDFHVHSAPDSMPRSGSAIQIAQEAKEAGMRAIMFKDHFVPSFVKAQLAAEVVEGIALFGGLTLNNTSGGMNPRYVAWGIKAGAKQIMFPTLDARHSIRKRSNSLHTKAFNFGEQIEPVTVIKNGEVTSETDRILEMIAEAGIILSTGHMDAEEVRVILKKANEYGIKKIIMEHPNFYCPEAYTIDDLIEFSQAGAVMSLSFGAMHPLYGSKTPDDAAKIIRACNVEKCMLITDFGQAESPIPTEGMRTFCEIMLRVGITKEEIYTMVKVVPAKLLDLE
jgi:histidinol phosphatase-like PHP family hydrolase